MVLGYSYYFKMLFLIHTLLGASPCAPGIVEIWYWPLFLYPIYFTFTLLPDDFFLARSGNFKKQ